jgi:hypothetical protein
MIEAAKKAGRPITIAPTLERLLSEAGFTEITVRRETVRFYGQALEDKVCYTAFNLESISLGLFYRQLGMSHDEILVFLAQVRREILNKKIPTFWNV